MKNQIPSLNIEYSFQWKKILWGKGTTKLKQMKGIGDRERRRWPGTSSMTENDVDDQCNQKTFNNFLFKIIVMRSLI